MIQNISRQAILTFSTLVAGTIVAYGQEAGESIPFAAKYSEELIYALILVIFLVILGVILALTQMLVKEVDETRKEILRARGVEVPDDELEPDIFDKLVENMTDAVPVEQEEEIMLDHEYDGIRELDNSLPPWWKLMFYATVVWAFGYMTYYHVLGYGQLSAASYEAEMEVAREEYAEYLKRVANMVNESNVEALVSEGDIKKGSAIYFTHCVQCHADKGQGLVGPNLTDDYWKHGGGIKNIFATIKYGVPAMGMKSWQGELKPREIQEVASYILTLRGTNPPDAKEPEGELYIPEEAADVEETESVSAEGALEVPDSVQVMDMDTITGEHEGG